MISWLKSSVQNRRYHGFDPLLCEGHHRDSPLEFGAKFCAHAWPDLETWSGNLRTGPCLRSSPLGFQE